MKHRTAIVASIGLVIGAAFTFYLLVGSSSLSVSELQRRSAFERHASIHHQARAQFDVAYNQSQPASWTPEKLAKHFGLSQTPQRVPVANGGYEVRVEVPSQYSRLIMMWTAGHEPTGYAWEIMTPASTNVSWEHSLAARSN